MKAIWIARRLMRETLREPQVTLLFLLFPAMLIVIYYAAYGGTQQGMARFLNVLVYNQDQGPLGAEFIQTLRDGRFDGKPVFNLHEVASRSQGENLVAGRKQVLLLVIPPDFSAAFVPHNLKKVSRLELVGDPANDNYLFAVGFIDPALEIFSNAHTGWDRPVLNQMEFVTNTGKMSDLQVGIPGVLVFAVLFGTLTSAMLMVREEVSGTLQRLRLSRMRSSDLLIGLALQQMLLGLAQLLVAFGTALAFGFSTPGSYALAVAIGLSVSLTATGLGLITACFSHSDGQAAILATIFLMPFAFLSGAVYPLPPLVLGKIAGRSIGLFDFLSTTHAAQAMRRVLVFGDGPAQLTYELTAAAVLTAAILALGIGLFQRLKLSSRSAK